MPELLDFDKDLVHLETASKVFQFNIVKLRVWDFFFLVNQSVAEFYFSLPKMKDPIEEFG